MARTARLHRRLHRNRQFGAVKRLPQSDAIDHMAVMDALAELTPQMRVCMTLHYLDGWRVPEIAQMLDIPEGTVKTRLMHARKRMETLLREVET